MSRIKAVTNSALDKIRILFKNVDKDITYRGLGDNGRFGNQLWQIFSTLGIASRFDKLPKLGGWKYRGFFSFPEELWLEPSIWTVSSPSYAKYLGSQAVYLQDLALLPTDFDFMKSCLLPHPTLRLKIDKLSKKYSIHERHAIHIRRGDYLENRDYHTVPDLNWYKSEVRKNSLVFTDDVAWCTQFIPRTEVVDENEVISWLLMSRCESFLISASSYSWWAAYISGSFDVKYPKPWSPQSPSVWNTELFLPKHFEPKPLS